MGRVQPQLPLLLHVPLGQAEQPLPPLPARVVHTANGEIEPPTSIKANCSYIKIVRELLRLQEHFDFVCGDENYFFCFKNDKQTAKSQFIAFHAVNVFSLCFCFSCQFKNENFKSTSLHCPSYNQ